LSRQEELELQAEEAESIVTVRVEGVSKVRSGVYKVPYTEGRMLRHYLQVAGLVLVGSKHAMRDMTNPEKGRLRTSYVPSPDSVILIGPANYSPVLVELRQKKADAVRVAESMPARGEATMEYDKKPKKQKAPKSADGVEQW
jgi:hypothetical protein